MLLAAERRVQQYKTLDYTSASAKLNGELVGYDAPKRPAEKLVGPDRINGLEPVRIACRHATNRSRFSFAILRDLVNSDNRAIQIIAQSPIRPAKPETVMNTAQRNTRTLLEDLNRDYFHRAVMSAQLLTQASNGRRVEQGAHRKMETKSCVDRGDHPHRGQRIPAQVEKRVSTPTRSRPSTWA